MYTNQLPSFYVESSSVPDSFVPKNVDFDALRLQSALVQLKTALSQQIKVNNVNDGTMLLNLVIKQIKDNQTMLNHIKSHNSNENIVESSNGEILLITKSINSNSYSNSMSVSASTSIDQNIEWDC